MISFVILQYIHHHLTVPLQVATSCNFAQLAVNSGPGTSLTSTYKAIQWLVIHLLFANFAWCSDVSSNEALSCYMSGLAQAAC